MMLDRSAFTIVVRSASERTKDLCVWLVQQQSLPKTVHIVEEKPFAKAHERSIEIALELRSDWTAFVDADILLRPTAVAAMHRELEANRAVPFYMMNFAILDRGFAGPSYGVHCYKTEMLARARSFMSAAYEDQRPETRLCKEMAKLGYPTVLSKTVVGLHDYEQFYRDLYRKMYVRGIKYNKRANFMYRTFEARYTAHDDYKVMMWGLVHGLLAHNSGERYAPLDSTHYAEKSSRLLHMLAIEEKPPLPVDVPDIDIEGIIGSFVPDDLYMANRHWIVPEVTLNYYGFNKDKFARRAVKRARRLFQLK